MRVNLWTKHHKVHEIIDATLAKITYKDNWQFSYDRKKKTIQILIKDAQNSWNRSQKTNVINTRIVDFSVQNTEGNILSFIHQMIRELELHESDEFLRYDGKMFWNPHINQLKDQEESSWWKSN